MKIPAIRGKMGDWEYYISNLTFQQINDHVSKVDDELHKSESLKDLIQRSITNNYLSIKEYILNQPEVFFNSLVLAVYDDYPEWIEIEVSYGELETYQIGLLDFPSKHKIFPVDGQHRVEGIKAALLENPNLATMRIPAIFIGHKNDPDGMQRTRRLFSTLNRYAKPVTMDDIIALDEDDIVAIVTRDLLESFDLFTGKNVAYTKQKALSTSNHDAFTSIITLYQCNIEIFKLFYFKKRKIIISNPKLKEYLKFRKSEKEIKEFEEFCSNFWDELRSHIDSVDEYSKYSGEAPAKKFRNTKGGNILFRPIGLLPFIKATVKIQLRQPRLASRTVFKKLNKINLNLAQKPWNYVAWNPISKSMLMNNSSLTELIFIFKYNKDLLTKAEMEKLKSSYASKISFEDQNLDKVLKMI